MTAFFFGLPRVKTNLEIIFGDDRSFILTEFNRRAFSPGSPENKGRSIDDVGLSPRSYTYNLIFVTNASGNKPSVV